MIVYLKIVYEYNDVLIIVFDGRWDRSEDRLPPSKEIEDRLSPPEEVVWTELVSEEKRKINI
jgi:hypothetical protein